MLIVSSSVETSKTGRGASFRGIILSVIFAFSVVNW